MYQLLGKEIEQLAHYSANTRLVLLYLKSIDGGKIKLCYRELEKKIGICRQTIKASIGGV